MQPNSQQPRFIRRETFNHLDPLEKLIGQQFIIEGKWKIKEE